MQLSVNSWHFNLDSMCACREKGLQHQQAQTVDLLLLLGLHTDITAGGRRELHWASELKNIPTGYTYKRKDIAVTMQQPPVFCSLPIWLQIAGQASFTCCFSLPLDLRHRVFKESTASVCATRAARRATGRKSSLTNESMSETFGGANNVCTMNLCLLFSLGS